MGRRKKGNPVHGWVILDKPYDMGSTQALAKVRRLLNAQKAGHAGTLDPLATGVLPIALGEATKTIPYMQDAPKTYTFTITWGEARSTDDLEGEIIQKSEKRPTLAEIEKLLPQFIGEIEQTPPKFSAIKINGERAYDLARDGETVELKSRKVLIESLKIQNLDENQDLEILGSNSESVQHKTSFLCTCGKGTYIRSIARDMGEILSCYGYISALRREAVGGFTAQNAISLAFLEEIEDKAQGLLPVEAPLDDIPALPLTEKEVVALRNGQTLSLISKPDFDRLSKLGIDKNADGTITAYFQGTLIALACVQGSNVKPLRVFNL